MNFYACITCSSISARNNSYFQAAGLEMLDQRDNQRCLAGAACHHIANNQHRDLEARRLQPFLAVSQPAQYYQPAMQCCYWAKCPCQ